MLCSLSGLKTFAFVWSFLVNLSKGVWYCLEDLQGLMLVLQEEVLDCLFQFSYRMIWLI